MIDVHFFRFDKLDKVKFRSKSGSENRNMKNIISGFKTWMKHS